MKQAIPWNKFVLEAIVIVGSILLAFGIQAWWDESQQQQDETVILQALLDDLNAKKRFLERNRVYNKEITDSAEKLLAAATGKAPFSNVEELDQAINGITFTNQEHVWESAPLNSLFSGGNISNPILFQELAALQANFNQLRIFNRNDEDFHANQLLPFLRENVTFLQIVRTVSSLPGSDVDYSFPDIGAVENRDHSYLLSNTKFQNLVIDRIYWIMDITNIGYIGLEERLDRIIEMLEFELADSSFV